MNEPLAELPSITAQEASPPIPRAAFPAARILPLLQPAPKAAATLEIQPLPDLTTLPGQNTDPMPEPLSRYAPPAPIAHWLPAPTNLATEPIPMALAFEDMYSAPAAAIEAVAEEPAVPAAMEPTRPRQLRLTSLDAYRGFIMLLMASGGLGIASIAKSQPDSLWARIAPYLQHAEWIGCTPWDLIQPAFMFMVGVAMSLSLAKREAAGQGFAAQLVHAVIRAIVLVALGVLCASVGAAQTNWVFTNVLAQIGLGYVFLFLLSRCSTTSIALSTVFMLLCCWLWFAMHPVPSADFPLASVGMTQEQMLPQPFTPWSKSTNAAADLDRLLLNALPRKELFVFNEGGYQTLNFAPALATMVLGLLCGRLLRSDRSDWAKVGRLILWGAGLAIAGWFAGEHLCPLVKRIWTPSWVLFSGGLVMLMLSAFYVAIEMLGLKKLSMPLVIIGMNSIFVYLATQLSAGWIKSTLKIHLGEELFAGAYGLMIERGSLLAVLWLLCWWLHRRRAFLSI
jgi:predicted acyltransferase